MFLGIFWNYFRIPPVSQISQSFLDNATIRHIPLQIKGKILEEHLQGNLPQIETLILDASQVPKFLNINFANILRR